jgi:hypothetical protein
MPRYGRGLQNALFSDIRRIVGDLARRADSAVLLFGSLLMDGRMADHFPPVARKDFSMNEYVIYCDSIQSAGLHNGNARILATRFGADGKSTPAVEMIFPIAEARTLMAALQKISR